MKNTFTQPGDFWKERDFGAKFSAVFEFLGAHWRPLGRVMLYLVVPAALLQGIVASLVQPHIIAAIRESQFGSGTYSARYATYLANFNSPWYLLSNVASVAFHTILILSVYGYLMRCVYAEHPGAPVTAPDVWAVVKRKFLGTFFSLYGIWLLIAAGFVVFFFPGFYLMIALSLFFAVDMMEDHGFVPSISRSLQLVRGKWWSTFGLLAIMLLVIYVVFAGIGVVAVLGGGIKSLVLSTGTLSGPVLTVVSALSGVLSIVLYLPLMLVLAFQYFNLVERKEGVGLRQLVHKLGDSTSTAPVAESDHYRPDDEGEY